MRYYKLETDGKLLAIGTGNGGIEISKEEYDSIMSEIKLIAELTEKLYNKKITENEIPENYKNKIIERVNKRLVFENDDEIEISDNEAMSIIMGVI